MNLGDLKNPKAAEAAFKAHRRKFSAKVCLAPDTSGCGGGIISAHTLSLKAMLTPIARAGHVYTPVAELFRPTGEAPVQFKLKGLRDTSVFNGFCRVHDAALFDPIENQPFAASRQQAFLHAFRAVAKESYLKRKQAEGPMSLETIRSIHGFGNEADFRPEMQLHLAASLRGAEEIERVKCRMDALYRAADWDRLVTTVIPFGVMLPIVASFIFSPDFDFAGKALQNFENFSVDLDQLFVTVLPAAGGIGYALFSHFDTVGLGIAYFSTLVRRNRITPPG